MTRNYRVLRRDGDGWAAAKTVEANDALHAIRLVAGENGTAGSYAAIPARNWTQVTVLVEPAAPRIVLEEEEQ
jgi:hypothetical protein